MDKPIPEAVRLAIYSNDLYQVLMDVQNGIDSPGLRDMANSAIRRIDSARKALTAAQQQGQAVAWMCWHPNVNDGRLMPTERDLTSKAKAVGWQSRPLVYGDIAPQPMQQGGGEVSRFNPSDADRYRCFNCGLRIADHVPDEDGLRCKREAVRQLREILAPPSAPVGADAKGYVITPRTPLFHKLGEHLHRLVNLADDTIDLDSCIRMAVDTARSALADYLAIRDASAEQPAAVDEARVVETIRKALHHSYGAGRTDYVNFTEALDFLATQHQEPTS